jgi:hypothetical protein
MSKNLLPAEQLSHMLLKGQCHGVNDAGGKFSAGVNDGDGTALVGNIFANFQNKSKWRYRNYQEAGDDDS